MVSIYAIYAYKANGFKMAVNLLNVARTENKKILCSFLLPVVSIMAMPLKSKTVLCSFFPLCESITPSGYTHHGNYFTHQQDHHYL